MSSLILSLDLLATSHILCLPQYLFLQLAPFLDNLWLLCSTLSHGVQQYQLTMASSRSQLNMTTTQVCPGCLRTLLFGNSYVWLKMLHLGAITHSLFSHLYCLLSPSILHTLLSWRDTLPIVLHIFYFQFSYPFVPNSQIKESQTHHKLDSRSDSLNYICNFPLS